MSDDADIIISLVEDDTPVTFSLVEDETPVVLRLDDSSGEMPPIYTGDTVVVPEAFQEQILPTKNTVLLEDITVTEIPYAEVSNIAGGYTVSIAS